MGTPDNDRRNLMQRMIVTGLAVGRSPQQLAEPSKDQIRKEFEEAWRNTARVKVGNSKRK